MPKLAPYVARKGGTFLFRRRPPVHSALAGRRLNTRRHVAVALHTRDPREAGRRAAMINTVAEAGWLMELPDDEVRDILRALTAKVAGLPDAMPPARRVEAERRLGDEAVRAFQGMPSRLEDPDLLEEFLDEFGWPEMPSAAEVAEQFQYAIAGHVDAYLAAIRRGEEPVPEMEALRAKLDGRNAGKPDATPPPAPKLPRKEAETKSVARKPGPDAQADLVPNDPNGFARWAGAYIDRRLAGHLCARLNEVAVESIGQKFRRSSLGNYQGCVRLWTDAMGNRPVKDYTPQDALAFLTLLERVPANHGKSGHRMPIRDAIAAADESEAIARAKTSAELRNAPPGIREDAEAACAIPRLRTATIQRHLSNLHTMFEWAVISGERPENPFARTRLNSVELAARRAAEADPERSPWGNALPDLLASRIFVEPLKDPGDPLFWVPLLGLFAGLRMEEALQLKGSDFQTENGIHILLVRQGANQSVKSKAGRRSVPIHSALIELGLLRLAEDRKSGRLFPGVARSKQRGSLSETFTKSFGRYREREKLSEPGRDFHSLRSDFNKQMADAGEPKHIRARLIGHSGEAQGLTDGTYLRGEKPIERLKAAIETISTDTSGIRRPYE